MMNDKINQYDNAIYIQSRLNKMASGIFYIILIGVIAGLGSIIFDYLCQIGVHYFLDYLAGYRPPPTGGESELFAQTDSQFNRWILLFLPVF